MPTIGIGMTQRNYIPIADGLMPITYTGWLSNAA